MMHPPPEAFLQATEQRRAELERSEPSVLLRFLGWALAVLLMLTVHVGLYLALTQRSEKASASQEMPAAIMIDMSPEPTVAKSDVDNAKDGPAAPDAQQAQPEPFDEAPPPPDPEAVLEAPPPPPQVAPQAVLPPTIPKKVKAPEPKALEPKPPEKPRRLKKPAPKIHVQKKSHPSAASRSGGGPKSDQQNANRTAAAAAGSAISQASRATWQNEMRARIVRAKRFPPSAAGAVGVSVVSVTFAANGSVTGARLIASSGNAALDAEAVAVMYRAAPFPPPPGGQPITQTIPLNFSRR
ncbi:TonB family protein [Methylobacterium sp. Leaf88]|uniref:energy transducer TonB family protein n=1 Tax=Methylobacterium sp. Leaf88 TaxID=1736244 RepID=UPI00070013ED|nr:TonB family protein [Methylobacterium sp. Leaf88]KQO75529.1 energy transducer TonB [Methylobacterium sp. Leaf88]